MREDSTVAPAKGFTGTVWGGVRGFWGRIRKVTDAQGAKESGLARLMDLHAISMATDMLVAVALANTLFFNVSASAARPKVGLYLAITMVPFVLLAPVIGPVLDRYGHGRRYALAATLLIRAMLAWAMASEFHSLALYPCAFGSLIASRAYGVARSAAVPRVLPHGVSLVKANARVSLSGIICASLMTPIGAALGKIGPQWPLRIGSVLFLVGVVVALRLPAHVDATAGETTVRLLPGRTTKSGKNVSMQMPASVRVAVRGAAVLRALSGFLTLFLAFQLRDEYKNGAIGAVALGGLVVGAGLGSFAGTATGARMKLGHPHFVQFVMLSVSGLACAAGAVVYTLPTTLLVALIGSYATSLTKLSLDSLVQREIDESSRASAFSRIETALQLSWVVAGAAGLIPMNIRLGLAAAAVVLGVALVLHLMGQRTVRSKHTRTTQVALSAE
jgi:MFS family permease